MKWSVAAAKQRLSELLRAAAREPQAILSRSRPVAVVVAPEAFEEFAAWQAARRTRTVAEAFDEMRASAPAGYALKLRSRRNRRSGFPGGRK
jgi:prevent-host-death family protein